MSHEDFTDLNKIKDRIAKLLRMADDASSPNEAAIAASRARKLMDKYQLSQLDINDSVDEDFSTSAAGRMFAALPQHLSIFSVAVAKYNDVQSFFDYGVVDFKKKDGDRKKVGKQINFRGYASDVQLAIQMYDTLLAAVDRLCKEYLSDKGYAKYPVGVGGKFKMAAILEISVRLSAMTVERDKITNESTGTSLVLMKSIAVSEKFGAPKYKEVKVAAPKSKEDTSAYDAGRRAGRSVEITKTVESE